MSTLANAYSDYKASTSLNIEARGMAQIRRNYPAYANMIVQALEVARYYSFNALHNLDQVKHQVLPGSRLDTFLKSFFGVKKRSEEHTSELQSLMRISYAVFCLKNKIIKPK